MLKDLNGKVEQIDISEIGFFVGGNRSENALFYADGLSKIIKNILTKTEDKDKLVITEDFFENISKYKNQ